MRRIVLVVIGAGMLVGCKKTVPPAWQEFGFSMDGVKETKFGTNDDRLTLQYDDKNNAIAPLRASGLSQEFDAKIVAHGYTHTCKGEYRYSDGDRVFMDGYTKDGAKLGLVVKFGSRPTSTLEVVVTKKWGKDFLYGSILERDCK
jgi:hypothetical protein